jgi:hypothetical protein
MRLSRTGLAGDGRRAQTFFTEDHVNVVSGNDQGRENQMSRW